MAESDRLEGPAFETRPPLTKTTQDASQESGRPAAPANAPVLGAVEYGSLTDDQYGKGSPKHLGNAHLVRDGCGGRNALDADSGHKGI